MKRFNIIKPDILFLICLVLTFFVIEISTIRLPGPYVDEAGVACGALDIKHNLSGRSFIKTFLSGTLPLMRVYHGSLDLYILLLLFSILPVGVESMRVMAIFFGSMTILLTYLFTKEFINKRYALLSVFLLVINPGFIMGTKIGMHYATIMTSMSMGVLLCLLRWYHLKKIFYFCLAMFLLGLGMWTRLQFFWFVFGLFLTAIIFKNNFRQRFGIGEKNNLWKYALLGGGFFLLGCSIIIYHEVRQDFVTIKLLLTYAKNPLVPDVNNLHYLHNLKTVIFNFRDILTGAHYFTNQFQNLGYKFVNNLCPWTLLVSILYLFVFVVFKRGFPYRKNILFLLVLFIGMLVLTPFSPTWPPSFHLYFFYPYIQLIISMTIITFIQYFKKLKILTVIFFTFFSLFIFKEINGIRGYFYHLNETGGRLFYSSAIYDLTEYLLKSKPTNIIVFDWGIQCVLDITSGGLIRPKDLVYKCKNIEESDLFLQDKNIFFIFNAKETKQSCVESFITTVKQLNLVPLEIKRFYERDGNAIYSVYIIIDKEKTESNA